ncbi:recombinase family protein [Sphingomonas sp. CV7422]|uniref:recombinase family protein n=1 Tax=Sphingomonas sp. CV7422 TaxID=3018036 RepID=UPI0022FE53FC|nr:recombinase family protein [Sphingomonas sp. CV7422]
MTEPTIRCAVYTRKSSEEGLEQSFNSLHAQREACEAYIASQKHEGWQLILTAYDDGGFSGGSMERPGLKALLADVEAGLIDTVVVYKVDRLTRALSDFARMVDRFDARKVSFVSVTQAFNTTTSMGRLTLNVLLSFAQFEREVTGERIRDKIAASKAKGMWMGGAVPLGYDVVDRLLVINAPEAEQVRDLFRLYLKHRNVDALVAAADMAGIRSKSRTFASGRTSGGGKLGRGSLYSILANPIYAGEIGHKGKRFPGQHERIVPADLYDPVQQLLATNRRKALGSTSTGSGLILSGLVHDAAGNRMTATHTGKANRRYCYYASAMTRVPSGDLDSLVLGELRETLTSPARLATALPSLDFVSPAVIAKAAALATPLAGNDIEAKHKPIRDMVERIDVTETGVTTTFRLEPLGLVGKTGCIVTPATLGRAKARLSLVVPGHSNPKPDSSLIAVIAQARGWLGELTSGRQTSIHGVAKASGVTPAYIRQHIGAGFLAPDLVTRIVEGRQPTWLTLTRLTDMLPLPADWSAQRALFAAQN